MTLSREEAFKFTWHFDNFSMCPQQFGSSVNSPVFVANHMEETKWKLCLYPRGCRKINYVACYLEKTEGGDCVEDITIGFHFRIISVHGDKNIGQGFGSCTFKTNDSWGCDDLCIREDIFDSAYGLLPNDTLTIECQLSQATDIEESENGEKVSSNLTNTNCLHLNYYSKTNQYSALTRIKVRSKSVLWSIERFCSLRHDEKLSKTVASTMEREPSFYMTFYLDEEGKAVIKIRLSKQTEKGIFIRAKIRTLGASCSQHQGEAEYYFKGEGNDVWRFPTFIKRKALVEDKDLHCIEDVLYLYCEFFCSIEGEEYSIKDFNFKQSVHSRSNCCRSMKEVYRQLYLDGTLSDVTIRAGTRKFKVHKSILAARSSVFKRKFESDVRGKESDVVDVANFDPDTMDRLLMFMYTNALEQLSQEDVAKLYTAADEYNVVSLKYRCFSIF